MLRFEKLMRNLGATVEHTGGGCRALVFYMHGHAFVASCDLTVEFDQSNDDRPIGLGLYLGSEEYGWMAADGESALDYVETTDDLTALDTLNEWIEDARQRQKRNQERIDTAMYELWCAIAAASGYPDINPDEVSDSFVDARDIRAAELFTQLQECLS